MNHPFFEGIDWTNLKKEKAPFDIDVFNLKMKTSCDESV